MTRPPAGLLRDLADAVGPTQVLVDADARAPHETDWTGRFSGTAAAVVRPGSTAEVVAVVRACAQHGVGLVPQGGNTGLVGGSVPRGGEVVLSLRRLADIGAVDASTPAITVGAGATLAAVDAAAAAHGLAVGVDLAARDSATIGGMVATNAGGIRVVAHGSMRDQLLGLEAVLADGSVITRLPGLPKDNAGYDLPQLIAGSEGTLAIITAVHLRLVPRTASSTVLVIGCTAIAEVLRQTAVARRLGGLLAAEVMRAAGVRLVAEQTGTPPPLPEPLPPFLLLLELAGEHDEALVELVGDRPAVVAVDRSDARRLWAVRERHTEAINRVGVPTKLDVTLPPDALPDLLDALDRTAPSAVTFGHVADGNLHISVLDAPAGQEEAVLRLVGDLGGSIASEHGIGTAKAHLLHLSRGPAEIAAMRAVKQALDPAGLLNPGAVLPPA